MKIHSIAFDWLHRCWKGTQIQLLQEKLQKRGHDNIIVRGEYYRTWDGSHALQDPYSVRRQKNKNNNNYDEKSNILNRELKLLYSRTYPNHLQKNNKKSWVIIQDRSIVWRYLFKHAEQEDTDNIDSLHHGKHSTYISQVVIPDIIFVLQPSKEDLLERLYTWFNPEGRDALLRFAYKKDYIEKKYENYYKWLKTIPNYIRKNIAHIQSNDSPEKISKEVITTIKKTYGDAFFGEDFNDKKA